MQHVTESAAILGQVDGLRRGADDRNSGIGEPLSQTERGLTAELHDDTDQFARRLFGMDHLEDVFKGQRFEIEPVRGVVVRRHGLRVAVDHHRLETGLAQRQCGVYARVVEFDALPDPVRSRAEDDHLRPFTRGDLVLLVVTRVVIRRGCSEFGGTRVDRLVHRTNAHPVAQGTYVGLGKSAQSRDLQVREAVPLDGRKKVGTQLRRVRDLISHLIDVADLVEIPGVDPGGREDLVDRSSRP